jgi:hypothetical protein
MEPLKGLEIAMKAGVKDVMKQRLVERDSTDASACTLKKMHC